MSQEENQFATILKMLEEQKKDNEKLRQDVTQLQQSRSATLSPTPEGSPSSRNTPFRPFSQQTQQSEVFNVQGVEQPNLQQQDEDVEDYLSYFDACLQGYKLSDYQKLPKLLSRLQRPQARFLQNLMKSQCTYQEAKRALTEQFGVPASERYQRFQAMSFSPNTDPLRFIRTAYQQLQFSDLPEQVAIFEIYKKLPQILQSLIKIKDIQTSQQLMDSVGRLKDTNVLELFNKSLQQLNIQANPQPVAANYNEMYWNQSYDPYYYSNNRKPRNRKQNRSRNPHQQAQVSQNQQSQQQAESQQQSSSEINRAVRFDSNTKQINLCDIEKEQINKINKDTEAYVTTRAGNNYTYDQQGQSQQCKSEQQGQSFQDTMETGTQEESSRRQKRRNSPMSEQQGTSNTPNINPNTYTRNYQNAAYSQSTDIVFEGSDICDTNFRINLSGLLDRMYLKIPIHQALALNNQQIVQIDATNRPVNIYKNDITKQQVQLMQSAQAIKQSSKVVVQVTIGNTKLFGIVDTGAECTILSTVGCKKANIYNKIDRSSRDKVRGISGVSKVFGYCIDLAIYIGTAQVNQDVAVMDNDQFDLLIGRDIIQSQLQNFCIDFGKQQVLFVFAGKQNILNFESQPDTQQQTKTTWYAEVLHQNNTLAKQEKILETFKNFPVKKKYNLFYGDLPYCYPKFHTSQIPYATESINNLKALPVLNISQEDAICLLWTSGPKLPITIDIMKKWGFKYKTILLVWQKQTKSQKPVNGLGYWTRSSTEILLMGSKGSIAQFKSPRLNINQLVETFTVKTERKGHSQKPIEIYDILKQIFNIALIDGIELFGCSRAPNNDFLDIYGNAIPNYFDEAFNKTERDLEQQVNNILYNYIFSTREKYPQCAIRNKIKDMSVYLTVISNHQPNIVYRQDQVDQADSFLIGANKIFVVNKKPPKNYYTINKFKKQISKNILSVSRLRLMTEMQYQQLNIPVELKGDYNIQKLFEKFGGLFSFDGSFKATNILQHEIQIQPGYKPIKQKQRKVNDVHKAFIADQVKELLEKDIIFETDSDWVSPLVIVPKKNGKLRMCIDYRHLNEATVKVRYPSPFIYEDIINCLKEDEAQVFAVLDLVSGYWQVKMHQNSVKFTAFTCYLGTFACSRMQFGLCNAVACFQKMMNIALASALGRICFVYIDDIVVYAKTTAQLTSNLHEIFDLLMKANLTISPSKCVFYTSEIQLLGQVISQGKVRPQPEKLQVLQDFRVPNSVKEIQQFLGLVNYFRNYIPAVAELSYPLQKLVSKTAKFRWGEAQNQAFLQLKAILKSGLFLYIPSRNAKLIVQITVTTIAYSGLLLQELNGLVKPLQFISKQLPDIQVKMSNDIREIRAVIYILQEWQYYLRGRKFELETDVQTIQWLLSSKLASKTYFEWALQLEQFDYKLIARSENQLKHLRALIALNKQFDWAYQMEQILILEAKSRELEVSLKKDIVKINPLTEEEISKYEIVAYTDGACSRKVGKKLGSAAFIIYDQNKNVIHSHAQPVEIDITNNVCEYKALSCLLQYMITQHWYTKRILVIMDAQLVINQIKRIYSVGNEALAPYYREVMSLYKYFKNIKLEHVPREFNQQADQLCKRKLKEYLDVKAETIQATEALPHIIDTYNVVMEDELANQVCEICRNNEPARNIILCDHCSRAYHMACINLATIPMQEWFCEGCAQEIQELNLTNADTLDPAENQYLRSYLLNSNVINEFPEYIQDEIRSLARNFTLIDGKLCYNTATGLKRVPTVGERALITKQIHQALGHYGVVKTLDMVRQSYWWPRMTMFVSDLVKKCLLCQANHARYPQLNHSYALDKGIRPFTHVSVDLFYLPLSEDGYNYVVVGIDAFTKWPEAKALRNRDSQTMASWLHREIVCRYGAPVLIRTDNGGEFFGAFHDYLVQNNIQHIVGSPYHPETQGQVERTIETIKNGVRKLFNTLEYRDSWPELLPNVLLGIRTSISRATKYSPSQLLMGRDLVLPKHQVVPSQFEYQEPTPDQIRQYFDAFITRQDQRYDTIYDHLAQMDVEIKKTIDCRRKRNPKQMVNGDMIIQKADPHNALNIDANGPLIFIEYTDQAHNACRYLDPETRIYGKASISNVKLLNL